jgi:hypothetical protein
MELRQRIVNGITDSLQRQETGCLERDTSGTKPSLWTEYGLGVNAPSQVIVSIMFGNNLCSDDLGICMSCITHLKRMVDAVGSQAIDAALPILALPVKDRSTQCYHKTSLSDVFRFASLGSPR